MTESTYAPAIEDLMAATGKPMLTPDQRAAQLDRLGVKLGNSTLGTAASVSFSFAATDNHSNPDNVFAQLGSDPAGAVAKALRAWSDVANVTFHQTTQGSTDGVHSDAGQIVFAGYTTSASGASGMAQFPGSGAQQTVALWIGTDAMRQSGGSMTSAAWIYDGSNYDTMYAATVHEIGHAIGLSHPSDYAAGPNSTYAANASYAQDTKPYSIMSYFNTVPDGAANWIPSQTPGIDDIAAAQRLYGANMSTRTGDTTYGFNSNADQDYFHATSPTDHISFAVWDAGGSDTFDFSGFGSNRVIDLREGHFSSVGGTSPSDPYTAYNVSIAYGVTIENAIGGSGSEFIHGNAADNHIVGGGGNDLICGDAGSDLIQAGDGNDHLYGYDYVGAAGATDGADEIHAGGGNDYVQGNGGNDLLFGDAGDDRIQGGQGDDQIHGGDGVDAINGNVGNDLVHGDAGDDVIHGGQGNDVIHGDAGNDILMGDLGNDTIDGGQGLDYMTGGQGSDTFTSARGDAAMTRWTDGKTHADVVTDFEHGTDHISFDFGRPDAVIHGTHAAADLDSAASYAKTLLAGDDHAVAAVSVGGDTALFFHASDSGIEAVVLTGVDQHVIGVSDFI